MQELDDVKIICYDSKIYVPQILHRRVIDWYHLYINLIFTRLHGFNRKTKNVLVFYFIFHLFHFILFTFYLFISFLMGFSMTSYILSYLFILFESYIWQFLFRKFLIELVSTNSTIVVFYCWKIRLCGSTNRLGHLIFLFKNSCFMHPYC